MIARTIEVTAEFTKNIIQADAAFSEKIISANAVLSTNVNHYYSEYEDYDGAYNVIPDWEPQVLATNKRVMHDNVTVEGIYINSVTNPQGGNTVYIGGEIING